MRNRRRHRDSAAGAFDQINMGPLLDLTFLLLIVFMITMPLMEYGTRISPPEMDADSIEEQEFISVTLTDSGEVTVDNDIVERGMLIARLTALKAERPKAVLLLRGDRTRTYGDVIGLMADMRRAGFDDVTLVTQPEEKR